MTGFVPLSGLVGAQPPSDIWIPTTTANFPVGYSMIGYDAYFGWGEFVYAKAAAAQECGSIVYLTNAYVATDVPNTAGLGYPLLVAKANMPTLTYGWYQKSGLAPVSTANSVATGVVVGIGGAGQAGTNSAGKQLLGAYVAQASTFAITKTGSTYLGGKLKILSVPNVEGLFVGMAVSGTGVGASAVITAINPNGVEITVDIDSTAAGTVTLTFTYTGYLLVMFDAMHGQGAIT